MSATTKKVDFNDHLACPICFEIPRAEVYQCKNGHQICQRCRESISDCPLCRVPFGTENIRIRAIEALLDAMVFPCSFKETGCPDKVPRKDLDSHEAFCKLNPTRQRFCSRILGWEECKSVVNESTVLDHFEAHHPIKTVNGSKFQIGLELLVDNSMRRKNVNFDPLLIKSLKTPILIRSVLTSNLQISLTCFMFKNSDLKDYRVKYSITPHNKEADLEWTGYAQPFQTFETMNAINSFCIPMEFLEEYFKIQRAAGDTLSKNMLNIKAAVFKASDSTAPSLKEEIYRKVNIFQQTSIPAKAAMSSSSSSNLIFYATCDICELYLIRKIRYKCLECPDYDLCSRCMELGHHNHHVFACIQDRRQEGFFSPTQFQQINSVFTRMTLNDD